MEKFPNALIGVPTGKNTGIFVIDIDQSDSKNGEASFADEIDDPITCQTRTVSGGRHIIFKYPQAQKLRKPGKWLGPDIDTRGEGGYVIWAGSNTESVPIPILRDIRLRRLAFRVT